MSRISPGTLIVLIFAVLFGLVGAYAVRRQLTTKPQEAAQQPEPERPRRVSIPLAAVNLDANRPLTMGDIAIVTGTPEELAKRYKLPASYMVDSRQIIGRVLRKPLTPMKAFSPDLFYPDGMGPSVAERLKPGYRAVTVNVDGSGMMHGFATPTSIVDVLFRSEEQKDKPATTVTLIEGVEVLALDKNAVPGRAGNEPLATVTLAVTSSQANALKIAEGRGEFSLALRNPNDDSLVVSAGPRTLQSLLNIPETKKPFRAEVFRGGAKTYIEFPANDTPSAEVKVTTPIRHDAPHSSRLPAATQ